jgi:16S rRNA (adenine1518-N6/adenine1519-N6)-dimethyltransferase
VARRKLGQHFLTKGSILERIAAAACPEHCETVVEIGPGRGALTEKLLQRAHRVVAVEVDPYLVEHVRRKFAHDSRLLVVHADVLTTDLSQWGCVPIVGNLPYYITSPILEKVLHLQFPRAVFLIQKEVAERLVAKPGTRAYGLLTVLTALRSQARILCEVKPTAFYPPPKVHSAVVMLEPRMQDLEIRDPDDFARFLSQCFRQKRKTLRNNLAGMRPDITAWPESGRRAEQLSLEQLAELYQRMRS